MLDPLSWPAPLNTSNIDIVFVLANSHDIIILVLLRLLTIYILPICWKTCFSLYCTPSTLMLMSNLYQVRFIDITYLDFRFLVIINWRCLGRLCIASLQFTIFVLHPIIFELSRNTLDTGVSWSSLLLKLPPSFRFGLIMPRTGLRMFFYRTLIWFILSFSFSFQ